MQSTAKSNVYDCSNPRAGAAVIFNQKFIKGESVRNGTDKDAIDLGNILAYIGFDVKICNDFSVGEIKAELYELSQRDHSDNDCLFVCVMSHGREGGKIFAADGEFQIEKLYENFYGEMCPSLVGKPKLFFIQACRGKKSDSGSLMTVQHSVRSLIELNRSGFITGGRRSRPIVPSFARSFFSGNFKKIYVDPMTDFLIVHSTSEGFCSYRNNKEGSWFIQALCEELRKNLNEDVMTITTNVNRRVAFAHQSNIPNDPKFNASKQMPNVTCKLLKKMFFNVKSGKNNVEVVN